jgi:hypothetical protein
LTRSAFDAIPAPLRDLAPAEGRWSIADIVEHLALVEARVSARLSPLISEARASGLGAEPSLESVLPAINVGKVLDRGTRVTAMETVQPTGLSADAAWTALEEAGKDVRDLVNASDGLATGHHVDAAPRHRSLGMSALQLTPSSGRVECCKLMQAELRYNFGRDRAWFSVARKSFSGRISPAPHASHNSFGAELSKRARNGRTTDRRKGPARRQLNLSHDRQK